MAPIKRKSKRDATGRPTDQTPTGRPQWLLEAEKRHANAAEARVQLLAGQLASRLAAARLAPALQDEREREAQRELDEHRARLQRERDWERSRHEPNPWLKPWDEGYNSPREVQLRAEHAQRQGERRSTPAPVRARGPRRRPDGLPASARETTATTSQPATLEGAMRNMTPEEVAKRGPAFAAKRRRYLANRAETRGTSSPSDVR